MPNYRAYLLDDDGHVMSALNLSRLDDDAAADTAKQWANDHDVELWQFDRLVAVFKSGSRRS
jgi:hypothetical protein